MKRRDLLKYTGIAGMLAAFAPVLRAAKPVAPKPRRLLMCIAGGGWDPTYSIDPKTQSATVDVPPNSTIKHYGNLDVCFDATARPNVDAFFTKYGANTAIVRGISVASVAHAECMKRICTGTRESTSPDMAAIVAHDTGNQLPLPYLILGQNAFSGSYAVSCGRVGATNQILALLDPAQAYATKGVAQLTTTTAEDQLLRDYAAASAGRERATRGAQGYNRARIDDFVVAIDRGKALQAARAGFGHRGNTLSFTNQIDLAIRALSTGISQTVMLDTHEKWDTHLQNATQSASHDATYLALTDLIDQLAATAGLTAGSTMLDDTIVVVCSEMGRSPRLNANAGKDHWPVTSALVIGGSAVKGGRVFGATTADVKAETIDFTTGAIDANGTQLAFSNFVAGVIALCGSDPSQHFAGVEVFDAFVA